MIGGGTGMASGRKKTHEEFVEEVKALVGDEYSVVGTYVKSSLLTDVLHIKCGHNYQVRPNDFLKGNRCPKCYGTHKKTTEIFKNEVSTLVGNEYTVLGSYKNTFTPILLMHETCKNTYYVAPGSFLQGTRCPYCHSKARKTHEEFIKEVSTLVGNEYVILSEYSHSKRKIRMAHRTCGREFSMVPNSFLRGHRCPRCRESKGERVIANYLEARNLNYTPQKPVHYDKKKTPLRFDFFVHGVAVEYDGEQHYRAVDYFGGETTLRKTQRRDRIKDKYCADNGIPLIRIPYWEYDNIDAILTEKLLPLLKERKYSTAS